MFTGTSNQNSMVVFINIVICSLKTTSLSLGSSGEQFMYSYTYSMLYFVFYVIAVLLNIISYTLSVVENIRISTWKMPQSQGFTGGL